MTATLGLDIQYLDTMGLGRVVPGLVAVAWPVRLSETDALHAVIADRQHGDRLHQVCAAQHGAVHAARVAAGRRDQLQDGRVLVR